MAGKENNGRAKPKDNLTATADIGRVLRVVLHNNQPWKNCSSKLTKTIGPQPRKKDLTLKNQMTEEEVDRLFNKPKTRIKTETCTNKLTKQPKKCSTLKTVFLNTQPTDELHFLTSPSDRDFIASVKFLRHDDVPDKYLTGLKSVGIELESRIWDMMEDSTIDLTTEFKKQYHVGKVIGEGAYASVRVAFSKALQKQVAIKIYQKSKISDIQRKMSVRREIKILQGLSHPNIVAIEDVAETNNHLNIVMEYLEGISLSTFLETQPGSKASEKICQRIFRPLAEALAYLHSKQIAHRDIKLQNVIIEKSSLAPKLIDFGFSTCIERGKQVKLFCGTPSYMAPEIVQKKEYRGETADVWALGVLLYISLTGTFPFKGDTDEELFKKINASDFPKNEHFFSRDACDLLNKMLKVNPSDRLTVSQILKHVWFRDLSFVKKQKPNELVGSYQKLRAYSKENDRAYRTNERRLTETCKDSSRLELKLIKKPDIIATQRRHYNPDLNSTMRNDKTSKPFTKKEDSKRFLRVEQCTKRDERYSLNKPRKI